MKGTGYINTESKFMGRFLRIYPSIQELRLCSGEVDGKHIKKVKWETVDEKEI